MKKYLFVLTAIFLIACSARATNSFQIAMTIDSPVGGYDGITSFSIVDPMIMTVTTYDQQGFMMFEIANGDYFTIMVDTGFGKGNFTVGVKYDEIVHWSPNPPGPALAVYGDGRGYLSIQPDSYFKFRELQYGIDGAVDYAVLCFYQNGDASWPNSAGQEWGVVTYDPNDHLTQHDFVPVMTIVPEPSSLAILGLGALAFVFKRRG